MIIFWIVAGLLMVGALLLVIPPLIGRKTQQPTATSSELNLSIYRDQLRELESEHAAGALDEAQYRSARNELDGRVIEDESVPEIAVTPLGGRRTAIVVALAVPILAVSLYLALGNLKGLDPKMADTQDDGSHAISSEQIQAMVDRLEQRLAKQPNDADGWVILARSYEMLERYEKSSAAYARALELLPDNAQLMADYADVLATVNGSRLQGEPEKIIQRALKADPNNLKALALAGTVAYERRDFQSATGYWQKILGLVPPDSPIAISINRNLSEVRKSTGQKPENAQQASGPAKNQAVTQGGATVSGTVRLAPAFKAQVADTDTIFIFARAAGVKRGPPLAILRKTVKDLPISFTLDDTMAMSPSFALSSVTQVVVGARISRSGNAMPSKGDIEGYSLSMDVGAKGVDVTIGSTVN